MPYITQRDREQYDPHVDKLVEALLCTFVHTGWKAGHLNYCFTKIIARVWARMPRYLVANGILGVLDCVGKEFYHRWVAPYEDEKREANGDVG